MDTATQTGAFVHTLLRTAKPEEVVAVLLVNPTDMLCIALDLQQLRMTPLEAASWIDRFHRIYRSMAVLEKHKGLPPSVAVFADSLTKEDEAQLLQAGAVVFDRSLVSNRDCPTSEVLLEHLDATRVGQWPPAAAVPRSVPPQPAAISREDLEACSTYPHGLTKDDLEKMLSVLNGP